MNTIGLVDYELLGAVTAKGASWRSQTYMIGMRLYKSTADILFSGDGAFPNIRASSTGERSTR